MAWELVDNIRGPKGDKGDAGTISSVSAATVPPGSPAQAELAGTPAARHVNFKIPQGVPGDKGDPGSIASASAESVPAGENAQVIMTGTDAVKHAHFKVPRGLPGVDAVPADEAVAEFVSATDSETHGALLGLFQVWAPNPTGNRALDQIALQGMIDAAQNGVGPTIINLRPGTYKVTGLTIQPTGPVPKLQGAGAGFTILEGNGSAPVLTVLGNEVPLMRRFSGQVLTDCAVTSVAGGTGIEFVHATRVSVARVNLDNLAIGVRFHNRDAGRYTEFCTVDDSFFGLGCVIAVAYKVTAGDASFHATGLRGNCVIEQPTAPTAPALLIGEGCRPYNAPLEVIFFTRSTAQPLILNQSTTTNPMFYGTIRVDNFTDGVVLAGGATRPIFLAGSIMSYGGAGVTHGNIRLASGSTGESLQARPFSQASDYATVTAAAGAVAFTAVTFPAGRFTQPPQILLGLRATSPQGLTVSYASVTTSGFEVKLHNATALSVTVDVSWLAIQMRQSVAGG